MIAKKITGKINKPIPSPAKTLEKNAPKQVMAKLSSRSIGQPCIRGMRLTVRRVVQAVALYPDRKELRSEYPELKDQDIQQALEFAARNLDDAVLPTEAA